MPHHWYAIQHVNDAVKRWSRTGFKDHLEIARAGDSRISHVRFVNRRFRIRFDRQGP